MIGRVFLWLAVGAVAWASLSVLFALVWGVWHRSRHRPISEVWTRYLGRAPDSMAVDDDLLVEFYNMDPDTPLAVPNVIAQSISFVLAEWGGEDVVVVTPVVAGFCNDEGCSGHPLPNRPFVMSVRGLRAWSRQMDALADMAGDT